MEMITIPKDEYLELIDLYRRITEKMNQFETFDLQTKKIDAFKFCGKISISEDALAIQKHLRNDWE